MYLQPNYTTLREQNTLMCANCCFTKLVWLLALFRIIILMHSDLISVLFCFTKKRTDKNESQTYNKDRVLQKMGIKGVRNKSV